MANPNYGYGQPGGPPSYGQPAYGAQPGPPGYGQAPPQHGAPGGVPPAAQYGAPSGQYGAPPTGQPGYGAPPRGAAPGQGYSAPPQGYGGPPGAAGQPRPAYGAPPNQGDYRQPPPNQGYPGQGPQGGYGAPPGQPGVPPGMDPAVYSWFVAVDQDRTGQISCTELQQALTNANWSHFNAETCRLMIGMFDKDQSGQIDMNEFSALWNYINQWKGVFEHFDRDRSGGIEAQELHTAFGQLGYNLSMSFVNMVLLRFDVETRRKLTLDMFIQACVLLKNVTASFRQRDTNMSGTVSLNYEDFMCVAMSVKP